MPQHAEEARQKAHGELEIRVRQRMAELERYNKEQGAGRPHFSLLLSCSYHFEAAESAEERRMRTPFAYCRPSCMTKRLIAARPCWYEYPTLLSLFRPLPLPALLSPLHPAHPVALGVAGRDAILP